MHSSAQWLAAAAIAALALNGSPGWGADSEGAPAASSAPESAVWQSHQAEFDYIGRTSTYTCDGLESKVRQLLVYLGARKPVKVRTNGCGAGDFPLGGRAGMIDVQVEFQTLGIAPGTAGEPTVAAYWTPLLLRGSRPYFMEWGDCELVEQMRQLLTANFSWRNLEYAASCFPHDVDIGSFDVRGEVLRAKAGQAG